VGQGKGTRLRETNIGGDGKGDARAPGAMGRPTPLVFARRRVCVARRGGQQRGGGPYTLNPIPLWTYVSQVRCAPPHSGPSPHREGPEGIGSEKRRGRDGTRHGYKGS